MEWWWTGFYRGRPEGLKKYGYGLTWIVDADDTRDTGLCFGVLCKECLLFPWPPGPPMLCVLGKKVAAV
jgi:hypothetical protein